MSVIDEAYFSNLLNFLVSLSGVAITFASNVIKYFQTPVKILTWSMPLYVVLMSSIVDIVFAYTIIKWVNPL